MNNLITKIFAFLCSGLLCSMSYASPNTLTYQGRILRADGQPLEYEAVSFRLEIVAPNGTCLIYQEYINNVDMRNSGGVFDLAIGQSHSYPLSAGFTVRDALNNAAVLSCYDGSTFTPSLTDGRRLRVSFYDGSSWHANPDMEIRSVPYAAYSESAAKLGNNLATDFILKNDVSSTNCDGGSFLTWNASTKAFGCAAVSGASGGTVTNVTASAPLSVVNGTSTPTLSLAKATSLADGYLSASDWVTFNNKQSPATTLAGYGITDAMQANASAGGDLSGNYPNPTVSKIKGSPVILSGIADGQILKYSSGSWVNSEISVGASNFSAQPQKTFLAGPVNGVDATPQFRALVASDLPSGVATQWTTSGSDIYYTTGKVGVGTSTPATKLQVAGSLMIGDGAEACGVSYAGALRYNSSSVQFCNGTAWMTLGTGSGTVISVTSSNTDISVANTTTTPVLTLNVGTTGGVGDANKIAKLDGSGLLAVNMIPSIAASKITSGQIAVANGGTGMSSGTSGGIPYFSSSSTMASSAALTANGVVLGGGAGASPTSTSAGAAYQILRVPSGGGAPAFGTIDLSQAAVVGTSVLPIANGGTGASTAVGARTNLGLGTAAVTNTGSTAGNVPVLGTGGLVANQMCVANSSATGIICNSAIPSSQWITAGSDIYYSTGKVGIGTSSPTTSLDVNGTVTATSFSGDGSGLSGVVPVAPGSTFDIPINKSGSLAVGDTPFQFKSKLTGIPLSSLLIGGAGPNWSNGAHIQLVADTSYWSQFEFFNGDSGTTATDGAAILFTGTDLDFNNREAGDLTLSTSNTKRVTVSSTGAVGIGTTSPLESLEVVGNIKSSGCLYYASSSLGTCASDQRIKKDVHSFDLGLQALLGIQPVKFKYNGLAGFRDDGSEQLGVIAQEVEKAAPELVQKRWVHLRREDADSTEIKVVDYGAFTYVIINAIKDFYRQWSSEKEDVSRKIASLDFGKVNRVELLKVQDENARLRQENAEMKTRLDRLERALGLAP